LESQIIKKSVGASKPVGLNRKLESGRAAYALGKRALA